MPNDQYAAFEAFMGKIVRAREKAERKARRG